MRLRNKILAGNSLNPQNGKFFQDAALPLVSDFFGVQMEQEVALEIGNPAKFHKFDFAAVDRSVVGECKNHSWTSGKNVPSAKMSSINEALFFLSFVPPEIKKFIVVRRDVCSRRQISIGEFYFKTYRHLLRDLILLEVDVEKKSVKRIEP